MPENKYWKIIETDNYGGDYPDELEICFRDSEGIVKTKVYSSHEQAQKIANVLNTIHFPAGVGSRIYMVVAESKKLGGRFQP